MFCFFPVVPVDEGLASRQMHTRALPARGAACGDDDAPRSVCLLLLLVLGRSPVNALIDAASDSESGGGTNGRGPTRCGE